MAKTRQILKERRKPKVYGYDYIVKNGETVITVNHQEEAIIIKIFENFVKNRASLKSIADSLTGVPRKNEGLFTAMTVSNILRRVEYCGMTYLNGTFKKSNYFDKIIDVKQWEDAQNILSKRSEKKHGSQNQNQYPLSGMLKCYLCENTFYYINTANKYYYHDSKYKEGCTNVQLASSKKIDEIVYTIFLIVFTSKNTLQMMVKQFNRRFSLQNIYSHNDSVFRLFDCTDVDTIIKYISREKSIAKTMDHLYVYKAKDRLFFEDLIERFRDANFYFKDKFDEYIKNTITQWYSNDNFSRSDILSDLIAQISIFNEKLYVQLKYGLSFEVNYKTRTKEWINRINKFSKLNSSPKNTPIIIQDRLDQLTRYLPSIISKIFAESNASLTSVYNSYKQTLYQAYPVVQLKFFTPECNFINTANTSKQLTKQVLYQINGQGSYYIDGKQESSEISVFKNGKDIIGFQDKNENYIDTRFLHTLPEWFYGYNYEYFKTDRGKICFEIIDGVIQAEKLGRKGIKTKIDTLETLKHISESQKYEFVDIEGSDYPSPLPSYSFLSQPPSFE